VRPHLGTILGAAQAEADDEMLKRAFVQTPDYHALLHSTDFNYVVGRRGTGKSALFLNLKESFAKDSGVILLAEQPTDYEMVELQSVLKAISSDYRILRPITRLLWTVHFLVEATKVASTHYRFVKSPYEDFLLEYLSKHSVSDKESDAAQCLRRLKEIVTEGATPEEIPRRIATAFDINHLSDRLKDALAQTQQKIVALYDRLDEGWLPESPAVAVLGGLAKASADFGLKVTRRRISASLRVVIAFRSARRSFSFMWSGVIPCSCAHERNEFTARTRTLHPPGVNPLLRIQMMND
jgi:hypothetical protein